MSSLKEMYEEALKSHGENSKVAKALKLQMECETYNKGRSFQELFETELGPKLQEINKS